MLYIYIEFNIIKYNKTNYNVCTVDKEKNGFKI